MDRFTINVALPEMRSTYHAASLAAALRELAKECENHPALQEERLTFTTSNGAKVNCKGAFTCGMPKCVGHSCLDGEVCE